MPCGRTRVGPCSARSCEERPCSPRNGQSQACREVTRSPGEEDRAAASGAKRRLLTPHQESAESIHAQKSSNIETSICRKSIFWFRPTLKVTRSGGAPILLAGHCASNNRMTSASASCRRHRLLPLPPLLESRLPPSPPFRASVQRPGRGRSRAA